MALTQEKKVSFNKGCFKVIVSFATISSNLFCCSSIVNILFSAENLNITMPEGGMMSVYIKLLINQNCEIFRKFPKLTIYFGNVQRDYYESYQNHQK